MTAKLEFKVDIDNTLKAHFADSLKDHYHQAMAREMIRSCPTLSYVAYKSEVLKTLGPNVKPRSITTSKLETSDIESPPKKYKRDSELDQKNKCNHRRKSEAFGMSQRIQSKNNHRCSHQCGLRKLSK